MDRPTIASAFEERTRVLIDQYAELEPAEPGHHVNGELTIGENIGDLGGLSIAYLAYRSPEGQLDGRADRRLHRRAAAVPQLGGGLAEKVAPEMVLQRLATDPHSPPEFRCNQIVRNIHDFYDAFGVDPRTRLWLDEGKRVKIW